MTFRIKREPLKMENDYTIIPIPSFQDNYIWAFIENKNKKTIIVDPGDATPVLDYLEQHQLILSAIFITHHHWDHTNGIPALKKKYNIPIYGSSKESIPEVTISIQELDTIPFDSLTFQIFAIPGHTRDHIAYYAKEILFCGDTLFAAGCGRLFEGSAEELYSSLQKIVALPDNTKIYCAHEYTLNNLRFAKTVEPDNKNMEERIKNVTELREKKLPSLPSLLHEEKETNPFLRCHLPEVIKSAEKFCGEPLNTPVSVFRILRKWKDHFV